jgi:hypothetical protein
MGTTTNLKPCNPSHKLDYPNLPNIAALFRLARFLPQHPGLELMVSFVGKVQSALYYKCLHLFIRGFESDHYAIARPVSRTMSIPQP